MLGLLLGWMAYDTAVTIDRTHKERTRKQEIQDLEFRLRRPMTRDHRLKCICRLCVNRRNNAQNELKTLLNGGN